MKQLIDGFWVKKLFCGKFQNSGIDPLRYTDFVLGVLGQTVILWTFKKFKNRGFG
jgi:hypothetical protein